MTRSTMVALACLGVLAGACDDGRSEVDVEQAARELEQAAVAVLSAIAPEGEVTAGVEIRPCTDAVNRETGEFVAELDANTIVSGGGIAGTPAEELDERAREALRANGFEIDEDFPPPAVSGDREDGIGVSVIAMPSVDGVAASGSTGCRPPAP